MNEEPSSRFWDHAGPAIGLGALAGAVAGLLVGLLFTSWWVMSLDQGSTQEALSQKEMSEAVRELAKEERATIEVVRRVSGAVVSVVARKSADAVAGGSPFIILNGEPLRGVEDPDGDGLVDVGSGTAFFVRSDGLLLTNRHVVDDEDARYFVMTAEGDEFEAQVVARDTLFDVAVLRAPEDAVPEDGFGTLTLSSDETVTVGQTVIAVGNALGEFSGSVTKGIVSGIDREIVAGSRAGSELIEEAIQTDAAINPGNSGGPLINLAGEVIGINTAVSGRGSGLGFAIPIAIGRRAVDDVVKFGRIVRPWLGIRYVMLDDKRAEEFGFSKLQRGAYILPAEKTEALGVLPDSPAARAGLLEGDVIVKLDGRLLTQDDNLATLLNEYDPEDVIELEVLRDGMVIPSVSVTLGEFNEEMLQ